MLVDEVREHVVDVSTEGGVVNQAGVSSVLGDQLPKFFLGQLDVQGFNTGSELIKIKLDIAVIISVTEKVEKALTAASPTKPFLSLSKSMKNSLILIRSLATRAWSLFSTSSSMFMQFDAFCWADGWKEFTTEMAKKK